MLIRGQCFKGNFVQKVSAAYLHQLLAAATV